MPVFDSWWIARTREEEKGRQVDQVQQEDGIGAHKREYIDSKNICMCRSIGLDPIVEPWTGRAASVANHVPACQRPAPVRSHDDPCGRTPRPIRDSRRGGAAAAAAAAENDADEEDYESTTYTTYLTYLTLDWKKAWYTRKGTVTPPARRTPPGTDG